MLTVARLQDFCSNSLVDLKNCLLISRCIFSKIGTKNTSEFVLYSNWWKGDNNISVLNFKLLSLVQ